MWKSMTFRETNLTNVLYISKEDSFIIFKGQIRLSHKRHKVKKSRRSSIIMSD